MCVIEHDSLVVYDLAILQRELMNRWMLSARDRLFVLLLRASSSDNHKGSCYHHHKHSMPLLGRERVLVSAPDRVTHRLSSRAWW